LVFGGFSDWYLPSRNELIQLYRNRLLLGMTEAAGYWSSSDFDPNTAIWITFYGGTPYGGNKNTSWRVRAVRSF
jgi:hypothetical protein